MNRYHVLDTSTGEVVKEFNRHPMLQPLATKPRGRASRPKSYYAKRRSFTQLKEDAAIAVFFTVGILATFILY